MMSTDRLASAFVEIADTLVDDYDLVEFLHHLSQYAAEITGAEAVGLLLADTRGELQFLASSNADGRRLEELILLTSEGPCWDCFRTGERVVNADLAHAADRWPQFAVAATQAGYRSAHALPLRLRDRVIGTLGMFGTQALRFEEQDVVMVQALADVASIAILQERALRRAEVLAEQLQGALTSRIVVEQAKGVVARAQGTTPALAFEILRRRARSSGLRLQAVAQAVIDGTEDAGPG